jgi:hypothetical protein
MSRENRARRTGARRHKVQNGMGSMEDRAPREAARQLATHLWMLSMGWNVSGFGRQPPAVLQQLQPCKALIGELQKKNSFFDVRSRNVYENKENPDDLSVQ